MLYERGHPRGWLDNASCFHLSFSFSARPLPPALVREVAARRAEVGSETPPVTCGDSPLLKAGAKAAPCNHFTNYGAAICKRGRFILADLLFDFAVI